MDLFKYSFLFLILILISTCDMNTRLDTPPPAPEKIPYTLEVHGDKRIDNYYWLRDDSRSDKKVLDYLKTENQYADNWFKLRKDYKSEILDELVNKIAPSEISYKISYRNTIDQRMVRKN